MKIGDYVRTNYGSIVKIEAIDEEVTLSDKHIYHSISEEDIKSIVTKEQFESMEYKVVE